jgi:hypothetical protein
MPLASARRLVDHDCAQFFVAMPRGHFLAFNASSTIRVISAIPALVSFSAS